MPRPSKSAPDKVLIGLKRLARKTKPGQGHTIHDIARECGVTPKAIRDIEQRALGRLKFHTSTLRQALLSHV